MEELPFANDSFIDLWGSLGSGGDRRTVSIEFGLFKHRERMNGMLVNNTLELLQRSGGADRFFAALRRLWGTITGLFTPDSHNACIDALRTSDGGEREGG